MPQNITLTAGFLSSYHERPIHLQFIEIEKRVAGERTKTTVRFLTGEERTEEVARMLSGARLTETSRKHAEQMLKANA